MSKIRSDTKIISYFHTLATKSSQFSVVMYNAIQGCVFIVKMTNLSQKTQNELHGVNMSKLYSSKKCKSKLEVI